MAARKRIVSAAQTMRGWEYPRLEYPNSTDDAQISAANYNASAMTFLTCAGRDVKVWDGDRGLLLKVCAWCLIFERCPVLCVTTSLPTQTAFTHLLKRRLLFAQSSSHSLTQFV